MYLSEKVIIVEGKSDKCRVESVIAEPVQIICTFGTMGVSKLDNILDQIAVSDIYILSDADKEGQKIRQWFKKHLSESKHIYIDPKFGAVARCPKDYLAGVLHRQGFQVKPGFLRGKYYDEARVGYQGLIQSYTI
ncbi:toprim domain-containing protein [Corticicoccus populi]|uniref:Toprim domain-containing protein n=1 Tax=Corticicoccus populi TaxID=1812821 RepID=A0ABW5WY92_9STAP